MKYADLAKLNVNEHIEKKNGLSYLSWAWAADQLLRHDPAATWTYSDPKAYGDTLMVFCTVKAFGKDMTAQLPVMDHRNKAIPNPDAFQVNTAMQRALAKAIALHGIGLYIYAGEDLPEDDRPASAKSVALNEWDALSVDQQTALRDIEQEVRKKAKNEGWEEAYKVVLNHTDMDATLKVALWSRFTSSERSAMKGKNAKTA